MHGDICKFRIRSFWVFTFDQALARAWKRTAYFVHYCIHRDEQLMSGCTALRRRGDESDSFEISRKRIRLGIEELIRVMISLALEMKPRQSE